MERSVLVHDDLSLHFWYESHRYAVDILNILPARNLTDSNNNPTTPYYIVHQKNQELENIMFLDAPLHSNVTIQPMKQD